MKTYTPTYSEIFDIMKEILSYVDNVTELGKFITLRISKLIDCQQVILIRLDNSDDFSAYSIIGKSSFNKNVDQIPIEQLVTYSSAFHSSFILNHNQVNDELSEFVNVVDGNASIFTPLEVGNKYVGLLMVIGIVDLIQIESALDVLNVLSGILALELNYSIHYQLLDDVTKKQLKDLRIKDEITWKAFMLSPDSFAITRANDGVIISVNDGFCSLSGYTAEEAIGKSAYTLNIWNDINDRKKVIDAVCRDGIVRNYEAVFCKKNGDRFFGLMSASLIDLDGEMCVINVTKDITIRKQIENELRESEQRYRTLAESGSALIWTSGLDKKCNYFNNVWLNFTGRSLEQEMGDGWAEGVHPDDLNLCFNTYANAFDLRLPFSMTYRMRHNDGTYRWILDEGKPRYDSYNEFIGYIGYCFDITELKEAEVKIRESEERLNIAQKIAKLGSWEFDVTTQKGKWSDQMFRIFNIEKSEYAPELIDYLEHIHPDDRYIVSVALTCMAKGEDFLAYEFRTNPTFGKVKVLLPSWICSFNEQNELVKYSGTILDITERKHAEVQAKLADKRFADIMKCVNLASVILDVNGKISFCNDYFLNLTGYKLNEVIGHDWFEMFIPAEITRQVSDDFTKSVSKNNIILYIENEIVTKEGVCKLIAWNNTILKDVNGLVIGIASLGEDITIRKKSEQQIKDQLDELTCWYAATLDREDRIIELKHEVNNLLVNNGQQPRYSDFDSCILDEDK